MKKFMIGLGVASLLFSIISGVSTSGFLGAVVGIISGIFLASVFFGISAILEGQETIREENYIILNKIKNMSKSKFGNPVCKKCGKEYNGELTSCPFCGYRDRIIYIKYDKDGLALSNI